MVVIGQIAAVTNFSDIKVNHHFVQTWKYQHFTFLRGGRWVCLKTFCFYMTTAQGSAKDLKKHYHENGIA